MEQRTIATGVSGQQRPGLVQCGIQTSKQVFWNLSSATLYEEALTRKEGQIAEHGPLVVRTGEHTGRSPNDKFFVREPGSEKEIDWGKINKPIEPARFDRLFERMRAYLADKDLFVQDCFAGADPNYRLPVRIVSEMAWQSLFSRVLFREATPEELAAHVPEFTVIAAPFYHADPQIDGTRSPVFVLINFARKLVLIGGTNYAGEIKKSIFTILNYLLPQRGVMPMHCSANKGAAGDVALFFGLSGTGKTTLSADPERQLIGDDEHGWSDYGVFNFEGGCYAKVINLSAEAEPEIYATTRRFGTVLENVVMDPVSRILDLADESLTENTRAAYPLSFIPNTVPSGYAGHPKTIIFLTADAFGVMPPLSKLTPEQTLYHFLSGYTAKVAGTEKGVVDPQATFSTCFGAPFMALHPTVYAKMLGKKLEHHHVTCWLVNTGWIGGPFGVGNRIQIAYTRAMIRAILAGRLAGVATITDPIFGLHIPANCPDVPPEIIIPRNAWSDPAAYDRKAKELAKLFQQNFVQFIERVPSEISKAGPLS